MSKPRQFVLIAVVALLALATGYLMHPASRIPALPAAASETLLAASLPDLNGQPQALAQWKGKVVLVNFWATWCAPCREEIPLLIEKQAALGARGLQVVGIAVDQVDKVRAYAQEMGINYPLLIGELEAMELGRAVGNELGGLPYTLVVDRDGRIARTELGILNADKIDAMVEPLL